MARRDEREYREYLNEEQRSQPGCPARELCREPRDGTLGGRARFLRNLPRRSDPLGGAARLLTRIRHAVRDSRPAKARRAQQKVGTEIEPVLDLQHQVAMTDLELRRRLAPPIHARQLGVFNGVDQCGRVATGSRDQLAVTPL